MGSGRYYARLSQTETLPAPEFRQTSFIWLLEAFDARWFDQNPGRHEREELRDFYESAELFVLEMHVPAPELHRFAELEIIAKADGEGIEPNDWFSIQVRSLRGRALGEGEIGVVVYSNLYAPGTPASVADVQQVSERAAERLRRVVTTDHIPDATEQEVDAALGKIRPIPWIVALDVGQGNAIGFCGAAGAVEVYFDLGGGVLANALTFPTALKTFCFSQDPPIILSHWDFDHWSSGPRDATSLSQTWIAPRQSVGPTHVALMTTILVTGCLLLLPKTFSAKWRGQLYLERCTGSGRNHNGLALTVSEKASGAGQQMVFPGDARYTALPSFKVNGYLSAVAPHHGADMRNNKVPISPNQSPSRLVYSCGARNTYGHPRPVTRANHDANGWKDPAITPGLAAYQVRETASRSPAMLGHVLLGWKTHSQLPSVPCGSGNCQLQAQQL
jgi:hypothetical protein